MSHTFSYTQKNLSNRINFLNKQKYCLPFSFTNPEAQLL